MGSTFKIIHAKKIEKNITIPMYLKKNNNQKLQYLENNKNRLLQIPKKQVKKENDMKHTSGSSK